jgi:hypothetical protein
MPDDPIEDTMSATALRTSGLSERRPSTSFTGAPTTRSRPGKPKLRRGVLALLIPGEGPGTGALSQVRRVMPSCGPLRELVAQVSEIEDCGSRLRSL